MSPPQQNATEPFELFAPGFTFGLSQPKAARQRGLVRAIQLADAGNLRRRHRRMPAAPTVSGTSMMLRMVRVHLAAGREWLRVIASFAEVHPAGLAAG